MAVSFLYLDRSPTVNSSKSFSNGVHFQISLISRTDLCGPDGATQGIGFLLGLCSVPLTVGSPIAGMLYDQTKSYKLSFILAGIPALVGASLMTLIHRLKDEKTEVQDHEQTNVPLAKPAWNEGITHTLPLH